jgi:hypothetical protein
VLAGLFAARRPSVQLMYNSCRAVGIVLHHTYSLKYQNPDRVGTLVNITSEVAPMERIIS